MAKSSISALSAEDWKIFLADPEKHWKTGHSARSLAYCWQEADGIPGYGQLMEAQWHEKFAKAKLTAHAALGANDTSVVLLIVFSRLYTLRNQILHGGATWDSKINRDQIRDAVSILAKLVPIVISLMMDNPNTLWGDPCDPVVD